MPNHGSNKGGSRAGTGHPPGHDPIRRWGNAGSLPIAWPAAPPPPEPTPTRPNVVPYAHLELPADWDFSKVRETMALLTPDAFRVIAEILRPGSRATVRDQLTAARDVVLAYAWDKPIVREQRDIRAAVLIQVTSRED